MEQTTPEELKIMPRGMAPRSVKKGKNMIAVASGKAESAKPGFQSRWRIL